MRLKLVLAVAALLSSSLVARADTLDQYDYGVGGFITVDQDTGQVVDSNPGILDWGRGDEVVSFGGASSVGRSGYALYFGGDQEIEVAPDFSVPDIYQFLVPGAFCSFDFGDGCSFPRGLAPLGNGISLTGTFTFSNDTVGIDLTLDQSAAVTPEPSSFALLGTGLLGMAGVLKRRMV